MAKKNWPRLPGEIGRTYSVDEETGIGYGMRRFEGESWFEAALRHATSRGVTEEKLREEWLGWRAEFPSANDATAANNVVHALGVAQVITINHHTLVDDDGKPFPEPEPAA